MELDFVKMHGLGNDFIFIDDFSRDVELSSDQVAFMCDRHFGIGADGVILVRPSETAGCAAYMHYINADGTLAQMCGNGVRCFAKYLVDRGFVHPADGRFVADTLSGPKPITFSVDDSDRLVSATVDMGHPVLKAEDIPVDESALGVRSIDSSKVREGVCSLEFDSPWGPFAFTCVSMGNPHAICFVDDWNAIDDSLFSDPADKRLSTLDIDTVGAFFESHPAFPEKTNVEFASIDSDSLSMRVYERGCGETLACGTGTCATDVAAAVTELRGRENDIHLLGGTLHIAWDADDHVMMTGPAEQVFEGTIEL